ncbi:MAG: hypothetical protein ACLP0B_00585 [Steroidobacteraceae bacterium]
MTSLPQLCVATSFFEIEPSEDRDTNPGIYGRAFANWIAERLKERGESVEEIVSEDWGRCVIVTRKPYLLWIGCGNRAGRTDEWGAFVVAEPGLLQRLSGSVDLRTAVDRLHQVLDEIMHEVPQATRVWSEDPPRR